MIRARMIPEAGLYTGTLRHRRFRPREHQFTYKLFMAWLDIDRIPELMAKSPWTSYNRFNWASFEERDHFGDPRLPLRERVAQDARTHGVPLPAGPIFLLTHLRYLGYCFNPISLYFCYNSAGKLETVLAEVNSTFGESRNYWLSEANQSGAANSFQYQTPKALHVSPFMKMELDYIFTFTAPEEHLVAHMQTLDGGDCFFDATLDLSREPWTAPALHRALVSYPLMTAKVIAAIHWQALRLYLKKVPVFSKPDLVLPKGRHEHPEGENPVARMVRP